MRLQKLTKGGIIIIATIITTFTLVHIYEQQSKTEIPQENVERRLEYLDICVDSEFSWLNCVADLNKWSHQRLPSNTKWPPVSQSDHFDNQSKLFDLSLRPQIKSDKSVEEDYMDLLKVAIKPQDLKIKVEQGKKNKANLLSYDYYPQILDTKQIISDVLSGIPVDKVPINDPSLKLIRFPKQTCNPYYSDNKTDFIVAIKSCVYCFDKRNHARTTFMQKHLWKNLNVRFVFVVGLPMPYEKNVFAFDGVNITLNTFWWKESLKYDASRWKAVVRLAEEANSHEDMLIGGFHDTYYNLTLKQILTFRWFSSFCGSKPLFMIYMDDDYALIPRNVYQFIRNHNQSYLRQLVCGPKHGNPVVVRHVDSSWALSEREFPWKFYPPYFHGATLLLGRDIIDRIHIVMAYTKYLRIDDAFLGIVMHKLGINVVYTPFIAYSASESLIEKGILNIPVYISKSFVNWSSLI